MNKLALALLFIIPISSANAQLQIEAYSDKNVYNYGEKIHLVCSVQNQSDTAITVLSANYLSCDAQFTFDNYYSGDWTACLAMSAKITFKPSSSYNYYWTVDPSVFGLPNSSGINPIVITCNYWKEDNKIELADTIYIEAPEYLGGQLAVSFPYELAASMKITKDSLGVEVLEKGSYQSYYNELWNIKGYNLDTLFTDLSEDSRFRYVELQRFIAYDSVKTQTITSVQKESEQQNKFYLSHAYPNPFNPQCKFYVELPEAQETEIELFNVLGEKIAEIYKGKLKASTRYTFDINGSKLPSGIYFYRVSTPSYMQAKKVVLLK